MEDPLIACHGLTKKYRALTDTVTAVNEVAFEVRRGDFVMIYGPSGCGKSSLINLLAGLDAPDDGDISFEGLSYRSAGDATLTRLRRSRIGVIFQSFELIPVMSCFENIEYPLLRAGLSRAQRRHRVEEAAEQLDIAALLRRKPLQVSGGQRQRVAIARTLATKPDLILGDEVTGNLDSANARRVFDLFQRLNRAAGQTFVLVSHDQGLRGYATRVLEMRDGCMAGGESC
jgi:putative ABC transport system ATP-binding protein